MVSKREPVYCRCWETLRSTQCENCSQKTSDVVSIKNSIKLVHNCFRRYSISLREEEKKRYKIEVSLVSNLTSCMVMLVDNTYNLFAIGQCPKRTSMYKQSFLAELSLYNSKYIYIYFVYPYLFCLSMFLGPFLHRDSLLFIFNSMSCLWYLNLLRQENSWDVK